MYRWLIVLLRILFPLDPVAQLREVTRYFISGIIDMLADAEWLAEFEDYHDARAMLEGMIASAEEGIKLLIHERACQILGMPYWYVARPREYPPRRGRAMSDITARLTRVHILQDRMEYLAQRRAQRMRQELEANPLRLAPSAQSTSPAPCAVESNHRRLTATTPEEWGRWIARPCAQDGGGSRVRGPPHTPIADCPLPIASVAPQLRTPPLAEKSCTPTAAHCFTTSRLVIVCPAET